MTGFASVLLISRLVLGTIFGLAGTTKLLDRDAFRRTLSDFGVPPGLAGPSSFLLPVAELVVAVALIPLATSYNAAAGAFALLLLFLAGISVNLVRGRRPKCQCFGQVHTAPIGSSLVVRNVGLSALALLLLFAGPGPSIVDWVGPTSGFERAVVAGGELTLALLTLQAVLLVALLRQRGQDVPAVVQERAFASPTLSGVAGIPAVSPEPAHAADGAGVAAAVAAGVLVPAVSGKAPTYTFPKEPGIPVGYAAPDVSGTSLSGKTISLASLRALGKPVLAVFSDPNCGPCAAFLPEVAGWASEHADALTVVVISRGTPEENADKSAALDPDRVLLQRDREIAEQFGLLGTPTALIVRPDGTIGSTLAQAEAAIRDLVARWAPPKDTTAPKPLDVAPAFTLPNLRGEMVTLGQFKGKPTLLMFWNPFCGFCERIARDVRLWEAKPLAERAQMVFIATGPDEDNRAQGFASEILLDPLFSVGPLYGVSATPSAVLIDADGRLTGPPVSGTTEVLALVGQPESPWEEEGPARERMLNGGYVPLTVFPVDAKPLRQECVMDEMLSDGSILLYNGCRRHLLTLNATAALIWDMCDGDTDIDRIVAEVRDVFPAAADPEKDVRDMLDLLINGGMIAPAEVTPAPVGA